MPLFFFLIPVGTFRRGSRRVTWGHLGPFRLILRARQCTSAHVCGRAHAAPGGLGSFQSPAALSLRAQGRQLWPWPEGARGALPAWQVEDPAGVVCHHGSVFAP